jgi:hypothetical protein
MLTIRTRQPISSAEDFDNVSAIWMMACNDEDAIITYAGIAYRLRWPRQDVARVRNLVRNRAELFSPTRSRSASNTLIASGGPPRICETSGCDA